MSNKDWKNINELDKIIQRTLCLGMMDNGTYLVIEYIWGFELFNTRPYHNYETWSGGYRLSDHKNKIRVEMEDLDDAVKEWARLVAEKKADRPIPRHNDLDVVSKTDKRVKETIHENPR